MGDKDPRSKAKTSKQGAAQKSQAKVAHDLKQAPPLPTPAVGRGKGK